MWNDRNRSRQPNNNGWIFFLIFIALMMLSSNTMALLGLLILIAVGFTIMRNLAGSQTDLIEVIRRHADTTSAHRSNETLEYDEDGEDSWDDLVNEKEERDHVYRHALQAVSAAGQDPNTVSVLVTDIGVMAARPAEPMTIYRTWTIPDDAVYAHPFVQLRVPTKASGRLRFEMLDGRGQVVFVDEGMYNLQEGKNLIVPPTRLPLDGARALDGRWSLRVSADGIPLALHRFEFQEIARSRVRRHMGEDGEIHADLHRPLEDMGRQKISLDELLADQDDNEKRARL
ncbi:MAG: hypothetical protein NZ750_05730 [Anaerolineae bacterium]|nr:hypothetical protein [Anaerolineae bacterium]MDW8172946.1 hypothetical protein [Anaerolineae bacterium]